MSSHFNIKGSQYEISNLKNRNVPALTIFFCFCITSTIFVDLLINRNKSRNGCIYFICIYLSIL